MERRERQERTTGKATRTRADAPDLRLRGRTYAIPFERVWTATLELAGGGLPRWRVVDADDREGIVNAEMKTLVFRRVANVRIDIGLDENAQTRVDLAVAFRGDRSGRGAAKRMIDHFIRRLDRSLGATPSQILDPTSPSAWSS